MNSASNVGHADQNSDFVAPIKRGQWIPTLRIGSRCLKVSEHKYPHPPQLDCPLSPILQFLKPSFFRFQTLWLVLPVNQAIASSSSFGFVFSRSCLGFYSSSVIPMPPERRRKLPEALWREHKPYIERLREDPSMTTTNIVQVMKRRFGFDAS